MKPLFITALMLLQTGGGPTYKGEPRAPHPFAPSLPTLTAKEQQALADIVDKFIAQDTGKLQGEAAAKAVKDFKALGPEATFALLEGLNMAANMEDSCPAVLIAKRLSLIVNGSKDGELLEFLRENIGAGVTAKRHTATLKDLRLACSLRKAALQRAQIAAGKQGFGAVAKQKPPAAITAPKLAGTVNKETGDALKNVVIEQSKREGDQPAIKFEIRLAENDPGKGLTEAIVAGSKRKVYLHQEAALTNKDIAAAKATEDSNKPAVDVRFTEEGAKTLAKITREHQGKPLAIMLDGKVLMALLVRDRISEGKAMITGDFTREEAARIVKGIGRK